MKVIKIQSSLLALATVFLAGSVMAAQPGGLATEQAQASSAYVKPHAPVDVLHKVLGPAVPGQPVEVEIILRPNRAAQAVSSDIRTGPGMSVSGRGNVERRTDGEGRSVPGTRQVVTFVPVVAGLHYVTVFASVLIDGKTQSRVVAIPVQVGKSGAVIRKMQPEMGELKAEANGNMVRSLPAQQTVEIND